MKQIFIIHGGDSFSSYEAYLASLKQKEIDYERLKPEQKWREWLAEQMPDADVLLPSMPNKDNAQYQEWKIVFEKLLLFFGDDVRLVGWSLGAMFLAIYLNDNPLPKPVKQLLLVAGGYDDDSCEDLGSFRVRSAQNLPQSADEIHLFHSRDDFIVPFSELSKYQADLPKATAHVFEDRGHFIEPVFPELLELLNQK